MKTRCLMLVVLLLLLSACDLALPADRVVPTAPPLTASAGDTWTRPADGAVMVYVPAGEFPYGPGSTSELPTRTFCLDAFWIDRTEVTNAQYARCVAAGICLEPLFTVPYADPARAHHPVVTLSHSEAQTYCQWVGGRLPKEVEWEKAARGTDGRVYPWGDVLDPHYLNYYWSGFGGVVPVGGYPENVSPYGALDMAGNACEWVEERWRSPGEYLGNPLSTAYRGGHPTGHHFTLRGGSWASLEIPVATFSRSNAEPAYRTKDIGFRCLVPAGRNP